MIWTETRIETTNKVKCVRFNQTPVALTLGPNNSFLEIFFDLQRPATAKPSKASGGSSPFTLIPEKSSAPEPDMYVELYSLIV